MNTRATFREDVTEEVLIFSRWAISALLDAVFLALWVLLQWGVSKIIEFFPLAGIEQIVLVVFQVVFAITTLIPVILYIWVDSYRMYIQAQRAIKSERNKDIPNENVTDNA